MIFNSLNSLCTSIIWIILLVWAITAYAYFANTRRADSDPKKKVYNPFAILLAPFTLPLFMGLFIFIFVLSALLFALFILAFTIAVIFIRKPFIFVWLDKLARKIGEPLLQLNTYLLKLAFGAWGKGAKPA